MLPSRESKTEFAVCIPICSRMLEQVCPHRQTRRISEYVQGIPSCPCSGAIPLLFHFQVTHFPCSALTCGSSVPVPDHQPVQSITQLQALFVVRRQRRRSTSPGVPYLSSQEHRVDLKNHFFITLSRRSPHTCQKSFILRHVICDAGVEVCSPLLVRLPAPSASWSPVCRPSTR